MLRLMTSPSFPRDYRSRPIWPLAPLELEGSSISYFADFAELSRSVADRQLSVLNSWLQVQARPRSLFPDPHHFPSSTARHSTPLLADNDLYRLRSGIGELFRVNRSSNQNKSMHTCSNCDQIIRQAKIAVRSSLCSN
jgi:hypothetical protein